MVVHESQPFAVPHRCGRAARPCPFCLKSTAALSCGACLWSVTGGASGVCASSTGGRAARRPQCPMSGPGASLTTCPPRPQASRPPSHARCAAPGGDNVASAGQLC
eukprot:75700-Chlamydomonas_euryale.AAC.3